jgi:hypothetical protein
MTVVSRKFHSATNTRQEPELKIERHRSKSERERKLNKPKNGAFKKESKSIKAAGK